MSAQVDLFGTPAAEPAPALQPMATYQHYSTKEARNVCAHCMQSRYLADRHNQLLPLMRSVAWRRQYGDDVQYLCYRHKAEAHTEDRVAGRLAKPVPGRRNTRMAS